jgi:uncharacterized membrane protein YbhN (UPF0104 family)
LALKLGVTAAAFAYLVTRQPIEELTSAVRSLSLTAVLMAVGLQLIGIVVGAMRWAILMRAYGAVQVPHILQLSKVYLIGLFYNTYVPGGIGGDVLRGVVSRRAFGPEGATSALAVVFVERALGLAGVLILSGSTAVIHAGDRFGNVLPYCLLGLFVVAGFVTALALGRRFARFAPRFAQSILSSLPELVAYGPFLAAVLLSVMTQSIIALIGHVLLSSIYAQAHPLDSFVAMPLAAAAGYFPGTMAGIGPRDEALVQLYQAFGVPRAQGLATAFAFLFSALAAAGMGGIIQLIAPVSTEPSPPKA